MKKTVIATALCAVAAAFAQSSVTLYGPVDDGLQYMNDVGGRYLLNAQPGGLGSRKIGFVAHQYVGAGMKVIFCIEVGFDPGCGKPGS